MNDVLFDNDGEDYFIERDIYINDTDFFIKESDNVYVPGESFRIKKRIQIPIKKIRLNMGGGDPRYEQRTGYLNINIIKYSNVDIILDLDNEFLPFKDNSIDGVIMIAILNHLKNPENLLHEVHRILKDGGALAVATCECESSHDFEFIGTYRKPTAFERLNS